VAERTDYALACRVYATTAGWSNLPEEGWLRLRCQNQRDKGMAGALVFDDMGTLVQLTPLRDRLRRIGAPEATHPDAHVTK
jgi:hypothetical protein